METGAALAHLGIPLEVVLDEWEALKQQTDRIADRFIALFESRLLPPDWQHDLDDDAVDELARTLARLQSIAKHVVISALDASLAAVGRDRLASLSTKGLDEPG